MSEKIKDAVKDVLKKKKKLSHCVSKSCLLWTMQCKKQTKNFEYDVEFEGQTLIEKEQLYNLVIKWDAKKRKMSKES